MNGVTLEFSEYTPENVRQLSQYAKELTAGCSPQERKVLSPAEVRMMLFRGTRFWVQTDDGGPVTLNATHFGKRKKNVWEPYANWYTAFTHPEYRRLGYAKELACYVRTLARQAGCVRLRSLAGSRLGYELHRSLGDQFWGITSNRELVVDTPIVSNEELVRWGREPFPEDSIPMGARKWSELTTPMDQDEINFQLTVPLRYDA